MCIRLNRTIHFGMGLQVVVLLILMVPTYWLSVVAGCLLGATNFVLVAAILSLELPDHVVPLCF